MSFHLWWLYATAVFLIAATPGPNMLHVMSRSVAVGPRRAAIAAFGCLTAVLICLFASAAGLGAVLQAAPRLFEVLRYAGVAYLVWLGVKAWRSPVHEPSDVGRGAGVTAAALYRGGLLTGMANPKLIIFAAALFPQFIEADRSFALQIGILVLTFLGIDGFWYCVYALGGARLARWLEPANRQRLFNRLTGGLFIAFGGVLLGSRA